MAINDNQHTRPFTPSTINNNSFDPEFMVKIVELLGYNGVGLDRLLSQTLQIYTVNDGTYDYFCFAKPGYALASAKWMIFRLDENGNKMYADGNANFDNVATSPSGLTYTYGTG